MSATKVYFSPYLFNFYSEAIIRGADLRNIEASVQIGGIRINNFRYADDTTLIAETEDQAKLLLMRVKYESDKCGLK